MKQIKLRDGFFALVDDDVFESIGHYNWLLMPADKIHKDYAYRWTVRNGKRKRVFLHREVLDHDLPHTDHRDGNGLNNQRSNLRASTCSQNLANRNFQKNNTSGFKGVTWKKKIGKWVAQMKHKKQIHIGVFTDPVSAAIAYDSAAIATWGIFARTNFQQPPTTT